VTIIFLFLARLIGALTHTIEEQENSARWLAMGRQYPRSNACMPILMRGRSSGNPVRAAAGMGSFADGGRPLPEKHETTRCTGRSIARPHPVLAFDHQIDDHIRLQRRVTMGRVNVRPGLRVAHQKTRLRRALAVEFDKTITT
jgi:hypothetical protein